uniref:Facilitated trehalose transporter tret1-like protein n=1 Tax=Triatoma infestans TaxID=30076 RepID=A0A161M4F9_TRIIF
MSYRCSKAQIVKSSCMKHIDEVSNLAFFGYQSYLSISLSV